MFHKKDKARERLARLTHADFALFRAAKDNDLPAVQKV